MYSFQFDTINSLNNESALNTGCYLCIWHANKIPPHIGILIDGSYFSLKVKGKDTAIPVNEILKIINRKSICALFVEVQREVVKSHIFEVFSKYSNAEAYKFSCLTPITEVFDTNQNVHLLADLLNSFKEKNQIGKVFGLNLALDFGGIPMYGKEEIEARLKALSKIL